MGVWDDAGGREGLRDEDAARDQREGEGQPRVRAWDSPGGGGWGILVCHSCLLSCRDSNFSHNSRGRKERMVQLELDYYMYTDNHYITATNQNIACETQKSFL